MESAVERDRRIAAHSGIKSKCLNTAAELEGFWAEASEALLLFPLTPPVRRALLQLMHIAPAAEHGQVCSLVWVLVMPLMSDNYCPLPKARAVGECSLAKLLMAR